MSTFKRIIYMVALLMAQPCFSQNWLPVGSGLDCPYVNYVRVLNLKENNEGLLIAGMIFGTNGSDGVCDTMLAAITWNGEQYSAIAEQNMTNLSTYVFDFQGKTYASGYFTIASIDNSLSFYVKTEEGLWSLVPGSFNGLAMDHYVHNDVAYISGVLGSAGGQPCALVCSFDGNQVVPVFHHPSLQGDATYSVTVYQDTLFVSGDFGGGSQALTQQGYGFCSKIVDGQMLKVGQGFVFPSSGRTLQQMDGKLYMGGVFTPLGSSQSYHMMYYENGQVHTLQNSPNSLVYAMKYYNGGLYVAGNFTYIGSMPCRGVARYDGEEWTCLCNQTVYDSQGQPYDTGGLPFYDLEIWSDTLYVGGLFNQIGNTVLKHIAKLDMSLSEAFPVKVTEQQRQELKLSVYPNPANDKINIQLSSPSDVFIYTATGQLLETHTSKSNYQIDVSRYPAGLYLVVSGGVQRRFVRE